MAFSQDGAYFATASGKGTLIRVFNVKERKMVRELRRGTQDATIECIAFSPDNSLLACTSDHGTMHVFCAVPTAN